MKLGNVAIDGTKMKANASTHRSVDYQKISEREQHWRSEVERLLNQAQQTDQEEDQRFGVSQPADPLPDETFEQSQSPSDHELPSTGVHVLVLDAATRPTQN